MKTRPCQAYSFRVNRVRRNVRPRRRWWGCDHNFALTRGRTGNASVLSFSACRGVPLYAQIGFCVWYRSRIRLFRVAEPGTSFEAASASFFILAYLKSISLALYHSCSFPSVILVSSDAKTNYVIGYKAIFTMSRQEDINRWTSMAIFTSLSICQPIVYSTIKSIVYSRIETVVS